jgi:hypothetical protein
LSRKEEKLRGGMRNWARLERDAKRERLKAELSERHLGVMTGEGGGGGGGF